MINLTLIPSPPPLHLQTLPLHLKLLPQLLQQPLLPPKPTIITLRHHPLILHLHPLQHLQPATHNLHITDHFLQSLVLLHYGLVKDLLVLDVLLEGVSLLLQLVDFDVGLLDVEEELIVLGGDELRLHLQVPLMGVDVPGVDPLALFPLLLPLFPLPLVSLYPLLHPINPFRMSERNRVLLRFWVLVLELALCQDRSQGSLGVSVIHGCFA